MLLVIYSNGLKTYVHRKTCIQMLIVGLFIIAKTWKLLRCPSIGDCVNNLWHFHAMKNYSTIKRNEISNHEKKWWKFKYILLTGRSQPDKAGYCLIQLHDILESQDDETVKGCQELGERRGVKKGGTWEIFRAVKLLLYIYCHGGNVSIYIC